MASISDATSPGLASFTFTIHVSWGLLLTASGRSFSEPLVSMHFAAHRREELRDRLDGFDGAEHLSGRHRRADVGQLDIHDVTQLLLREVGDADGPGAAVDANPLVLFGVLRDRLGSS